MNIAITGGTGLVGSYLSNYYIENGHNVFLLIKDEFSQVNIPNANKVYGNINVKSDIDYLIQKSLPDYFIHLAAQTQAYDSLQYPYNTFYTNMVGTLNVLESLREYKDCKAIAIASSDKAYGELEGIEYKENHKLNGIYPYDASKSITDLISKSYKKTYNMPIITTRACNIYGEKDINQKRLIPNIIKCYLKKEVFEIRNNGEDLREYIHVEDVVSAYDHILKYAEHNTDVDSFNISSGERFSTLEVFNIVENIIGKSISHKILTNNSMEIKKQFMNSSLLFEKTGWTPKKKFSKNIENVVRWYLDNSF